MVLHGGIASHAEDARERVVEAGLDGAVVADEGVRDAGKGLPCGLVVDAGNDFGKCA